uniref:E3 ubiquitin-protein ligase rififylin n=1 Tax=Zeugodacus cucurbitae TaxID=28588 RepID=A0A0A1X097_ZEUCU
MPCESCHVQFTVFRRKRICADCKRFYCSNCLSTAKRRNSNSINISSGVQLCRRCVIFAKRPLLRTDLLQLKPKDLIFYLQSKHVSTTGCVEKDELVGLVLTHVQQIDAAGGTSDNGSARSYTDSSANSFDSLKQTCQNFFTSITENISDSLNSFDNKSSPKGSGETREQTRSERSSIDSTTTHIFDQPRVSTREIPTYASFQQQSHNNHNNRNMQQSQVPTSSPLLTIPPSTATTNASVISPTLVSSSTSSVTTKGSSQSSVSPEISISSIDRGETEEHPLASTSNSQRIGLTRQEAGEENSDCECSDDELIATFSGLSMARNNEVESSKKDAHKNTETDENIGTKSRASADVNCAEMSSQSSFEELGAIGGISDESKAATDTNSSNIEQWQILETTMLQNSANSVAEQSTLLANNTADIPSSSNIVINEATTTNMPNDLQVAVPFLQQDQAQTHVPLVPQRVKKVTRRRSDSYLNRQRQQHASEDDSPTDNFAHNADMTLHEQDAESGNNALETEDKKGVATKRVGSCQRCGKHKATLRKQVEKMRRHLESAQLSEAEIKKELQDFLSYLEQRTKSMECSDTETMGSSLSGRNLAQSPEQRPAHAQQPNFWEEASMPHWEYQLDDNEGIHVYAGPTSGANDYNAQPTRFVNLDDFETIDDLEALSVKQLKEILMLNRVDYKGCCEKQELLDRVQRLWKNFKSAPAVDKLPTDELCKICMDAPIECVILECGHMATCTNCGKVLSECPICRQYIVRVVRFFRA